MKRAGEKWNLLTDTQKAPYVKMADLDKVRYEKQCAELEKKGYFILDDGTKSTDPANIPKAKPRKQRKAISDSEEEKVELPKLVRKPLVQKARK
jgi:hypothetical protein